MFWQLFHHLFVLYFYVDDSVCIHLHLWVIRFHLYPTNPVVVVGGLHDLYSSWFGLASVIVRWVPLYMLSKLHFWGLSHLHRPDIGVPALLQRLSQLNLKELETGCGTNKQLLHKPDSLWHSSPLPGYCPRWSLVLPLFVAAMSQQGPTRELSVTLTCVSRVFISSEHCKLVCSAIGGCCSWLDLGPLQ